MSDPIRPPAVPAPGDGPGDGPEDDVVIVPRVPGPLIPLARPPKSRDDLDDLIDELLPDSGEGPGWFDIGLLVVGLGLVAWAVFGDTPTAVLVVGLGVLALGLILPARSLWRQAAARRESRRRDDVRARGVPLRISDGEVARLADAYRDLVVLSGGAASPAIDPPGTAVAHSAVLEVATLLDGRPPATAKVRAYVERRAVAIEDLVQALRARDRPPSTTGETRSRVEDDAVVDARDELDAVAGTSTVDALRAEVQRLDGDV